MAEIEMHASATAIIMLGRGRDKEGEEEVDGYAKKCADAALWLANADVNDTALAVRGLSDNRESNGALFVADALKVLAQIVAHQGLLMSLPRGNA